MTGQDVAECPLYGQPTRDSVVDACCTDRLACSSPSPIQPSSRNAVPLCQLRRSFLILQGCLTRQIAACWSNSHLHCCQVRGDKLSFCPRDCIHGRWWLHH